MLGSSLSDIMALGHGPSGAPKARRRRDEPARWIVGLGTRILQRRLERDRPREVRFNLIASLFGRASNVLMVALAAAVCGGTAYVRTGDRLALVFAIVEVALLLTRCITILVFKAVRRKGLVRDADPWLVGFGAAAIASSIMWGALSFGCLAFSHDPVLYVLPVLSTVGTAGAVAARNSGVPRLAYIQMTCSLMPIVLGSFFADDAAYSLLAILTPAMMIGLSILVSERNEQMVELIVSQRELARLSRTDPLTGIANRRHFAERLARAWEDAAARAGPLSVLMIDVDHFKLFNDAHGHPAGDGCLCEIARILENSVRTDDDVVARYGGEEFAVLLHETSCDEAAAVAERLRAEVAARCPVSPGVTVGTISCGIASTNRGYESADALIEAADEALYRAKRLGRNRIEGPREYVHQAAA